MTEDNDNLAKLPNTWIWAEIGEIGDIVTGNTPSKKQAKNYGDYVPFVKPPELNDRAINQAHDSLSETGASVARVLPSNSILVSCIGILGKTAINLIPVAFNQQINAIILPDGIVPEFGFYYAQTLKNWLYRVASATTLPIVNKSKFQLAPIPLPPLPEQHRIVAKIEELFTQLDAGVDALKKIKTQLKRYRQAVLKYAFEGKLTEGWRQAELRNPISPLNKESASVLLERIKEERKKNAKGKLKELPPLDTSNLPELPEGWVFIRLEKCCDLITKGESPKWQGFDYVDDGIYFIRSENVLWGKLDFSNVAQIPEEFHDKLKRSQIKANDVLINLVGASIGRCGIAPSSVTKANINQAVALIRVADLLDASFLMHLVLSPRFQKHIHTSKVETARPNISLGDLRHVIIPFPALAEQHKIAEEIERRFSVADEIEKIVEQSLKQSERLRQSILKKAFEGKLVRQDPSDEPAEKLLERIKQEKSLTQKNQKQPKRKHSKSKSTNVPNLFD